MGELGLLAMYVHTRKELGLLFLILPLWTLFSIPGRLGLLQLV